ncbi:tyrosine-type recombinase/integrase [Natronococcus wangiae]|uniref:tyrosine-type recombinase/integrase n=1 Tax=Natronococcus wangiae TaxID=3068275 RepID=UPI00273FB9E8|nr:tyrosine-type recombinase/integrase [Natronococcus sp. AD5]
MVPPSLSTNGGRSLLKRLCEEAKINGDYLKPHGTRLGVGEGIYREHSAAVAQRMLRHADPRTTSQMYAHIEASELAEEVAEVLPFASFSQQPGSSSVASDSQFCELP